MWNENCFKNKITINDSTTQSISEPVDSKFNIKFNFNKKQDSIWYIQKFKYLNMSKIIFKNISRD